MFGHLFMLTLTGAGIETNNENDAVISTTLNINF